MKNRTRKQRQKVFTAFRLPDDVVDWLKSQSVKRGKTKTRLVEESIRARMILKGDA